ncbi:aminotransferase class I/II-fold pyridoxal phosphate-dependent enzyme [Sphingobium sp.]|uniref:aminotransferase class I/II-fold pyridoxal phosphate-dependent enzyme n=1 Tax=Sphingobium sp. TaxID=1912891 RepID=UPI002CB84AED|nr:aminotransferase class I/II-fold pyridoxal phosphate-dependent enzyme [Sphingobium sp.]HUD93183.1 aminotransferase class I/II-fold pyridoxal phosphate-dependent enzyme [Sphingobium sp.]
MRVSRRMLLNATLAAAGSAGAVPTLAQRGRKVALPDDPGGMVATLTDAIYINSNEHPDGPAPAALEALAKLPHLSGRYGMAFAAKLESLFARQNGLAPDQVQVHPGSFMPLRSVALTYSTPDRPIAYFEPTFDQGFLGPGDQSVTRAVAVPLSGDFMANSRQLLAAAPDAGVYYLCNPNNPTGLTTLRADIEWLLANKPRGSILLVDEAYIHFSDAQSCLDLVAKGADVLVTRTFSKIYGLAGLRCGLISGRKDLLDGMARYGVNITPMPAVIAAEASLLDPALLPRRKTENKAIRDDLAAWCKAKGLRTLPSEASFMMIHVGRPGADVTATLAKEGIIVGGPRKHMEDWVRVSMGTPQEMQAFKAALLKALA